MRNEYFTGIDDSHIYGVHVVHCKKYYSHVFYNDKDMLVLSMSEDFPPEVFNEAVANAQVMLDDYDTDFMFRSNQDNLTKIVTKLERRQARKNPKVVPSKLVGQYDDRHSMFDIQHDWYKYQRDNPEVCDNLFHYWASGRKGAIPKNHQGD